ILTDETELIPGQVLRIPTASSVTMEESSFLLEVSYRRSSTPIGLVGHVRLALPEFDVPAVGVTWHLYAPDSVAPLAFQANLTPRGQQREGPFRRLERFLGEALGGRKAWAEEVTAAENPQGTDTEQAAGHDNILAERKAIYRAGAAGADGDVAP